MGFKEDYTFEMRKSESRKIMRKYPSKVPIIVQKSKSCNLNEIDKVKYLVPKDLNMNHFVYIIRKRIQLEPSESLFIMVNNQLCPSNSILDDIYGDLADEDGFLYVIYTSENTFG